MFTVENGGARILLDTSIYRISAIQKTGYRLAARFTLVLGVRDGTVLSALLLPVKSSAESAADIVRAFYQELSDQELRENIAEQTKDMRALLLAHAFSRTDLVNRG